MRTTMFCFFIQLCKQFFSAFNIAALMFLLAFLTMGYNVVKLRFDGYESRRVKRQTETTRNPHWWSNVEPMARSASC
jgi:hypothetical protein